MCNPEYEKLVNDPVMEALRDRVVKIDMKWFEPDPFRQAVVEEAAKLPSIDRLREQRWDIIRLLIANHKMVTNKMTIVIDLPDDEVKPNHVVENGN